MAKRHVVVVVGMLLSGCGDDMANTTETGDDTSTTGDDTSTTETPTTEAPTTEAPTTEDPTTEDPTTEGPAECGNAVVESDEECDDGNDDNTDDCLDTCVAASCGDGIIQTGVEECDDGNDVNDDACSNACAIAFCGDGTVQEGEECDDGNTDNEDNCLEGCIEATCGDGFVGPGEGCDDANDVNDDECSNECVPASCGDGSVQQGELCDDGNVDNTDGCLDTCAPASCGDGYVWLDNEACDDGNVDNTDDCIDTCEAASCGDGYVWLDNEACDDANTDNTDNCIDTCQAASCGDGHIWVDNELCDDANTDNADGCLTDCTTPADCLTILQNDSTATDGVYLIDPDQDGMDLMQVTCDMTTDGGGWTLCAALTKGYVPSDMLYNADTWAFQAQLNSDNNFAFETDAPGRTQESWDNSETLNYGQFCRLLGDNVSETWLNAKMWNLANNFGNTLRGTAYNFERSGTFDGNLFTQWHTNTSDARMFVHTGGDNLTIETDNSGYGGPYITPIISWQGTGRTQSTAPWNGVTVGTTMCTGCNHYGSGYDDLPYGQTTILNDLTHSVWQGIPNVVYGWSDCTANGNCAYHESGMSIWLYYAR